MDLKMVEKKQHIDVCIASYKRPQLLAKLLASIAVQKLPEGISLAVIVVDNDPAGTARDAAENAMNSGLPLRYFMQPQKNISLTRNMGVANSSGDYIAFIDDDEHAESSWLNNLYETLHQYQADVVFGPVIGEFPPHAPSWLAKGRFFDRERYQTGTSVGIRGTGNVLLRFEAIQNKQTPFDPKYGLTGGEDADFFRQMLEKGCKFVWCDEALVWEVIAPERMTASWLIRRAFWGGQVFAEIYVKPRPAMKKIPWFIYRSILAMLALVGGLMFWPIQKAWGVRCFQKVASNIGQLTSLSRYRFKEYAGE
jgi:succinoglycan biosynthesis protein ExoM